MAASRVQGYLAHKNLPPPRTLRQAYAYGPMVVLGGGGAFSYERGTPVPLYPLVACSNRNLQEYLAHKKVLPPETLQ